MTFDVTSYVKFINMKCEAYMAEILKELTLNNPDWIEKLKADKEFFNEDGTPVNDMSEEKIKEKMDAILNDVDFKQYNTNWKTVVKLFTVTEEDLKNFIIEDNGKQEA